MHKTLLLCFLLVAGQAAAQEFQVNDRQIVNGYFTQQLPYSSGMRNGVKLVNPVYREIGDTQGLNIGRSIGRGIEVLEGVERARHFGYVRIPAYKLENNKFYRLSDFDLSIPPGTPAPVTPAKRTMATSSVLASGSWFKISVSSRGICKLDYNFFKEKFGISGGIPSGLIRVFGNGGTVLPLENRANQPDDLVENAIQINDGGDGIFGEGDYLFFYANGPVSWTYDQFSGLFVHHANYYEDKSYYFVNFGMAAGQRIADQPAPPAATMRLTTADGYQVYEKDLVNIGKIGKEWVGEDFSANPGRQTQREFSFSLPDITEDTVRIVASGAAVSVQPSGFYLAANGQRLSSVSLPGVMTDTQDGVAFGTLAQTPGRADLKLQLQFTPYGTDAVGYLNYFELNYKNRLSLLNGPQSFRDRRSVGTGSVVEYALQASGQNQSNGIQVWDVTDALKPVRAQLSVSGTTASLRASGDVLREFYAFDGSQVQTPEFVGAVANQNLHGLDFATLLIVTTPELEAAANRLADYHRQADKMTVHVTKVGDIYNEFGSGSADVTAIRDFVKMFYDRAGADTTRQPRYLLLFGDASYDYKNRISGNTNLVPTYESNEFLEKNGEFCNDDFFSFLDEHENIEDYSRNNMMDIGVGRLPVATADDANALVDKLLNYKSPASLGPWRLANMYVADNADGAGNHLEDADAMSSNVDQRSNLYHDTKVYIDNYNFVSTPGGARCPDANKSINDQIYKGTFMVNYCGHGNPFTLAAERILTADD